MPTSTGGCSDVLGRHVPALTDAAKYACSAGGKRVRPVLMAALHRALGANDTGPIHSLAAAFQLIHTATLVHDDVIDHAEMRRGRPSLPQAFGLPLAIVSGDYLFVRAFELASEYPRSIIMRCGEACADLVEGEVLQESGRFDLTAGREHYFRVVERKTAAIVAAALGSVAEIAGRSDPRPGRRVRYGRSLGIAFQIRDDLLDVYGDSDILGKPLYGDLREGNPTLSASRRYESLDGTRRAEFERLFGLRRKSPGDLLRLRALVDASGASGPGRRRGPTVGRAGDPVARDAPAVPVPDPPRTHGVGRGRAPVLTRGFASPRVSGFRGVGVDTARAGTSNESYLSRPRGRRRERSDADHGSTGGRFEAARPRCSTCPPSGSRPPFGPPFARGRGPRGAHRVARARPSWSAGILFLLNEDPRRRDPDPTAHRPPGRRRGRGDPRAPRRRARRRPRAPSGTRRRGRSTRPSSCCSSGSGICSSLRRSR